MGQKKKISMSIITLRQRKKNDGNIEELGVLNTIEQCMANSLRTHNIPVTRQEINDRMARYRAEMNKCAVAFNPTGVCNLYACSRGGCDNSDIMRTHIVAVADGRENELYRDVNSKELFYKGRRVSSLNFYS